MCIKRKIVKIVIQLIAGTVLAFAAWFGMLGLSVLLSLLLEEFLQLNTPFFLTTDNVFRGIWYLGMPIGSVLGIFFTDKLVYKEPGHNVLGMVMGYVFSIFAVIFGIAILGALTSIFMLGAPFIVAFFALLGYYFASLIKSLEGARSPN